MSKILRLLNNNFLIGISNLSLQVTSFVFSLLNRHEILKNLRQLPIYRVHICVAIYSKYIQGKLYIGKWRNCDANFARFLPGSDIRNYLEFNLKAFKLSKLYDEILEFILFISWLKRWGLHGEIQFNLTENW